MPGSEQKGFTLIELMLVVAILGVLAAIATPKFGKLIDKAKVAYSKGNLAVVRGALSEYFNDYNTYPSFPMPGDGPGIYTDILQKALEPYLRGMPHIWLPGNHHPWSNAVFHVWNFAGANDDPPTVGHGLKYDANKWDDKKPIGFKGTFGQVQVLCRHPDAGADWSTF